MQPYAEFMLKAVKELSPEALEPAGSLLLGYTQQNRDPLGLFVCRIEALAYRTGRHLDELYYAAARPLKLDRTPNQPAT
jgi:hypothetical protein